jgi:hypothetical protein
MGEEIKHSMRKRSALFTVCEMKITETVQKLPLHFARSVFDDKQFPVP